MSSAEATSSPKHAAMTPHHAMLHHLPVAVALTVVGAIYAVLSVHFKLGPWALMPGLLLALVGLLLASVRRGRMRLGRTIGLSILAIVTIAEAVTTGILIAGLLNQPLSNLAHEEALSLLFDAGLIWIANILTFSFWYWEIDGGGPAYRHHHGYHSHDFMFPQLALPEPKEGPWIPHYVDYLFLSFTTSTAFSPTDTPVISVRGKLLIMAQSLISLAVLAIIAARAVNTL